MHQYLKLAVTWIMLATACVISQVIIGSLLTHPEPKIFTDTAPCFLCLGTVAMIESAVLLFLHTRIALPNFGYSKLKQVLLVFFVYWGTKYLQMLIEALFFLNIWQDTPIMSSALLSYTLWFGLFHSLLFCMLAMFIFNKSRLSENDLNSNVLKVVPILKIAALYVPIYLLAGALVAIPLAGEAFSGTYENLQVTLWMPVLQFVRGGLWALIIWWIGCYHKHQFDSRLTAAICISVFSSSQLIQPNPFMADQLRYAHLIEMGLSMAIFGWLAAGVIKKAYSKANQPA